MNHTITSSQLDGNYEHVIASSSAEQKKIVMTITLQTNRFGHTTETIFFHVKHLGNIISSTGKLELAIRSYNRITSGVAKLNNEATPKPNTSKKIAGTLCLQCDHQDHCNAYLRNPERPIQICASFKPLK